LSVVGLDHKQVKPAEISSFSIGSRYTAY